jgi:hypothetical protein
VAFDDLVQQFDDGAKLNKECAVESFTGADHTGERETA